MLNNFIHTPELANTAPKLPDCIAVALTPTLVLPLLLFKYCYLLNKSR